MSKEFFELEMKEVEEYLNKLPVEDEKYGKSIQNYKTLLDCKRIESAYEEGLKIRYYDSITKRMEAEARLIEAEAKKTEAQNRTIEAEAKKIEAVNRGNDSTSRIACAIIDGAVRFVTTAVGHYLNVQALECVAEFERTGSFPNKLFNMANNFTKRIG